MEFLLREGRGTDASAFFQSSVHTDVEISLHFLYVLEIHSTLRRGANFTRLGSTKYKRRHISASFMNLGTPLGLMQDRMCGESISRRQEGKN